MKKTICCILFIIMGLKVYCQDVNKEVDEYINKIIKIASDNLPVKTGWTKFIIRIEFVHNYANVAAYYYTKDGSEIYFNPRYPNEDIDNNFLFISAVLRSELSQQNSKNGLFWQCIIEVNNNETFNVQYSYDVPDWVLEERKKDIR